jgi:nucleotide-binding universal stress UspA family protein
MSGADNQLQEAREVLLVAVDDSEGSDKAFDWAVRHVHKPGMELHLVRLAFCAVGGRDPRAAAAEIHQRAAAAAAAIDPWLSTYAGVLPAPLSADCIALRPPIPTRHLSTPHPLPPPPRQTQKVHVVPRLHFAAAYGVPPVDFVPVADSNEYEKVIQKAEAFIIQRFVNKLPADFTPSPIVHIIKVGLGFGGAELMVTGGSRRGGSSWLGKRPQTLPPLTLCPLATPPPQSEVDTESVGHILVSGARPPL